MEKKVKRTVRFTAALTAAFITLSAGYARAAAPQKKGAEWETAVTLAKRQSAMWSAAVNNDWEALYAFILPALRKKVPLAEFIKNPHGPEPLVGGRISGAVTTAEPDAKVRKALAAGNAPPFQPRILYYRFTEMRLSPDGRRALVVSEATVSAEQFIGPTAIRMAFFEFWEKDRSGVWYADLASTTLMHLSGAATGNDPMQGLTTVIDPATLAAGFVEMAHNANPEKQRSMWEAALWLDPFGTAQAASADTGMGELLHAHLDRVFEGAARRPLLFPAVMEVARWYAMIGGDEAAYRNYAAAVMLSPDDASSRGLAAQAAARLGRWDEAAGHYRRLLQLSAATGKTPGESLEPYIAPECLLCTNVSAASAFALAGELMNLEQYALAGAIYHFYAERNPGFADAVARLRRGEGRPLTEVVGDEIAREAGRFSYDGISKLLSSMGFALAHPGDAPAGGALPKGGVTLFAAPAVLQIDFSAGYFAMARPAQGRIEWNGGRLEGAEKDGWLLAELDRGKGNYFPDADDGGNAPFTAALRKLKKGTTFAAVRFGKHAYKPEAAQQKALAEGGIDAARFGGNDSVVFLLGVKGGKKGSARVYSSANALQRRFAPAVKGRPGMLAVAASGDDLRVRLLR